jgi:hypothetical protein
MTPEKRSAKIDAQIAQNAADIRRLIIDSRILLRRTERLPKLKKSLQRNAPASQKRKDIQRLRTAQAVSRRKLRKLVKNVDAFLRRCKKGTKE